MADSRKMKTSNLWNCFDGATDVNKIAICKICQSKLSYKSSTSNLKKHLERKHPTIQFVTSKPTSSDSSQPLITQPSTSTSVPSTSTTIPSDSTCRSNDNGQPSNSTNNGDGGERAKTSWPLIFAPSKPAHLNPNQNITRYINRKLTPNEKKNLDRLLMQLFIFDYQPFSIVQDRGFRAFVAGLNPSYQLPDRKVLSNSLLPALYETCLAQTKTKIEAEAETVCLTTDIWTSSVNDAYLGVTAHYIDNTYNLKSVLLECAPMCGSHTAENIKNIVVRIVQDFKLKEKVLIMVTDNASNMKSAVEKMGFKHFGCYAHTLNLVVKHCTTEHTADKTVRDLINKVKNIVSHYKKSVKATEKLVLYQKQNGVTVPKKVLQDVSTRWNSTLKMLERFVLLEDAIKATMALLCDEKWDTLTPEEWRICREMCIVLQPFDQLTETMSAEKYVSGSQILILTRGLISALNRMLEITDGHLEEDFVDGLHDSSKNLIISLRSETEKRFPNLEASKTIGVATLLDPRFKLNVFRNQNYALDVKKMVTELVAGNIKKRKPDQQSADDIEPTEPPPKKARFDIWSEYDSIINTARPEGTPTSQAVIEVQRYLELPILGRKENSLEWWRTFEHSFPNLAVLARRRLNFLATSVPCERLFSKAGNILNERRTRLGVRKVQQLLFLNSNFEP
ncbi:hypothetical protein PYW07_009199 [Mythimna separata]|uniref:BED-type domain-containing protein n=1 Tax=Mythimna separata TaxID=271217 RepID=A0AAD8DM54_MYTSE|nr:hypothetical protein PYW07_009199 [Mythimna separata]